MQASVHEALRRALSTPLTVQPDYEAVGRAFPGVPLDTLISIYAQVGSLFRVPGKRGRCAVLSLCWLACSNCCICSACVGTCLRELVAFAAAGGEGCVSPSFFISRPDFMFFRI